MTLDTMLVPLDGSPLAEMALPVAIDLLRDHPDATLIRPSSSDVAEETARRGGRRAVPGPEGERR